VVDVESIESLIEQLGMGHRRNFALNRKSPIKAGGTCDFFLEPNSREQLVDLVKGLSRLGSDYMVVGFLSNLLFRDGRIRTPIISTGKLKGFRLEGAERVHAEAGCSLSFFAKELTQKGFEGFSGLTGFPATIGGAIYMNASCYGNAISECLEYVECIDQEGDLRLFKKEELGFEWRHSIFHDLPKNYVIVSATFTLKSGDLAGLSNAMEYSKNHRLEYQEHGLPNLGSIFATDNIYREISRVNLKYKVGVFLVRVVVLWGGWIFFPSTRTKVWAAAMNRFTQGFFSLASKERVGFSKHTFNCVVNLGGGCATDIINFIENVKRKIRVLVPLEIEIIDKIE